MTKNRNPEKSFGKRICGILAIFFALAPCAAHAQTPTEEIIKNALQPDASSKNGLLVLSFSSSGITESVARTYSHIVAQNIANTNRFDVMYLDEAEDKIQKAAPELLPCFDLGCGIQIGNRLGVKWIIAGHIVLANSGAFILKVKLVNIDDNAIVLEESIRFTDENMDSRIYALASGISRSVPLVGKVVEANNKIALVSMGKKDGISVGDQLVVYREDPLQELPSSGTPKTDARRKNIAIIKITQVGEKISEAVYFQSIEIPKADHIATTYLNRRMQIRLIDHVRKELDTHERNVYEIRKEVDLSPVQLVDMEKSRWISKVENLESSREYWQYFIIGSGVATGYFLRNSVIADDTPKKEDSWKLAVSFGILGLSAYQYIAVNRQLQKLADEGRYKGYLELKPSPGLDGASLGYHMKF